MQNEVCILNNSKIIAKQCANELLRVLDLSGFVARNLSGCHIALGGRYAANTNATGDTEDEIRRSL
jgi:hypothetical protein